MTLTAFCDSCGKKIRVGQEYAGKKVKCLHCGHVLILPKRESFLSDPHVDFARRSETKDEEEPEPEAEQRPDPPPFPPAVPPPPLGADAVHMDHVVEDTIESAFNTSDIVRGLAFGFGFWVAGSFFLLLVGLVLLALIKAFGFVD